MDESATTPVPAPPADPAPEASADITPVETPASEPEIAPPAEVPSPAPESTEPVLAEPEPIPAPAPEPIVVPEPVIVPEPVPEPISVPTPVPEPEKETPAPLTREQAPATEPPDPAPAPPVTPPPAAEIDISQLSDEQLKAAAALYAKKNQSVLSRKGVEARQAVAQKNISEILTFIKTHSPASNRTIARALNLPPRRVQHYMQVLTHRGSVMATGWGVSREYRIK